MNNISLHQIVEKKGIVPMSKTMICPGCGLRLPSAEEQLDDRYNASFACRQLYDELTAYILSLQDAYFIHQFAVDAYTAQHAGPAIKPIALTFALAGLYLAFEHNYTGKQVQKAHTLLAATPKRWPQFQLPEEKASLTILDVLNTLENARNDMRRQWGKAVWKIWKSGHTKVVELVHERLAV
ncbi:MAG TPA: DUF5946 family protein [Ktedonobacteraceae bacterium]